MLVTFCYYSVSSYHIILKTHYLCFVTLNHCKSSRPVHLNVHVLCWFAVNLLCHHIGLDAVVVSWSKSLFRRHYSGYNSRCLQIS